mgnify:CR=1 FL=1
MSTPGWLALVELPPVSEEKAEALAIEITEIVNTIKSNAKNDFIAIGHDYEAYAKKFRAASIALSELPLPWVEFSPILIFRKIFEELAEKSQDAALRFNPQKKRGHPVDNTKFMAALACENLLMKYEYPRTPTMARIAALARWVWIEAHDGEMTGETLDAWESTVRRSDGRKLYPKLPRHKSKEE